MGVVTHDHRRTAVLQKVFYTSVLVSDQDKALDFYTNVVGLPMEETLTALREFGITPRRTAC